MTPIPTDQPCTTCQQPTPAAHLLPDGTCDLCITTGTDEP
jgi:hypothetical protein